MILHTLYMQYSGDTFDKATEVVVVTSVEYYAVFLYVS